jgi:hypothetical protein
MAHRNRWFTYLKWVDLSKLLNNQMVNHRTIFSNMDMDTAILAAIRAYTAVWVKVCHE